MCAATVQSALTKLPGVKLVNVNLKGREAVIRFDPTIADPARLADATTKAGFPSHVKESKSKKSQENQQRP